jgi:general stress protein 26
MNMNNDEYQKTRETLKNIVESANVAMLVTINLDGHLVSRPMQLQKVEFDGDLWFLTRTDTDKYDEIKHNDIVNVIIAEKSYASITGHAEIVDDIELKKEFWNKAYKIMFDLEYTDPRVKLIKIHAESAEYLDTGATIKSAVNFVKKVVGNEDSVKPSNSTNASLEL